MCQPAELRSAVKSARVANAKNTVEVGVSGGFFAA